MTIARRGLLFPGLAVVAAATDAINYLGLGHVFTANMTGNTVLLAIGVTTGEHAAALRSATALGGFLLGTAVGALVGGSGRAFAAALTAELATFAAWYVWWAAAGGPAAGPQRYGYVALSGLAMGIQSGAVSRLSVPGLATTFITGTMTSLSVQLVARFRRHDPAQSRGPQPLRAVVLPCYLAGAFAGGYAFHSLGSDSVVLPLAVLALLTTTAFVLPPRPERAEAMTMSA